MPITDWSDRIVIAELNDEPAFSDDMQTLLHRLRDNAQHASVPDVVVNLQAVNYMNSSNIASLLKLRKKLAMSGRHLRLCCVSDAVWSVLLTTGLDSLFTFHQDLSTSLTSLQLEQT